MNGALAYVKVRCRSRGASGHGAQPGVEPHPHPAPVSPAVKARGPGDAASHSGPGASAPTGQQPPQGAGWRQGGLPCGEGLAVHSGRSFSRGSDPGTKAHTWGLGGWPGSRALGAIVPAEAVWGAVWTEPLGGRDRCPHPREHSLSMVLGCTQLPRPHPG